MSFTSCRVCGRNSTMEQAGAAPNGWPLVRCAVCGTVMAFCHDDWANHRDEYDEMFREGEYEQHRREFTRISEGQRPYRPYETLLLRQIEKRSQGRVLVEIGGGTGEFGVIAKARGWSYTDFDISQVAVEFARKLGLDARVIEADVPALEPLSANLIVMWEVIEHIWNVASHLAVIRSALKPGGLLLLSTPNYLRPAYQNSKTWGRAMSPPIHVNFFTAQSLQTVLTLSGFYDVRVNKRRFFRPTGLSIGEIARCFRLLLGLEEPPTLYAMAVAPLNAHPE